MWLNFIARKLRFAKNAGYHPQDGAPDAKENGADCIEKKLARNIQNIKDTFGGTADLKIHFFNIGRIKKISGALVYIDGLVDSKLITDAVLYPLTNWADAGRPAGGKDLIGHIAESAICSGDVKTLVSLPDAVRECLSGCVLVYAEGCAAVLSASVKGWEKRGVTEPQSETVVRGPREGFTENLRTNTALIRRKIKSASLRMLNLSAGRKTATDICLVYLDGVADPKVIDTVRYRIENLDVDSILDSGYIEEYIEDAPFSPFATVNYTEKPDVAAARILEGRVGIIVDGTPFVLTAPMLFVESFQTTEDYYGRPLYASFMRSLRFIAYFITVFAPAIYIALTAFNQALLPTTLLFTIANAREGTPFPVFIEMFIMIFAFEILYEGGIRMPRPVGQAISIVGALVMGDAAVSAGLVGAPVVITVAITAVSSFLIPSQNDSASLLRIPMMLLASFIGWYGISMGFLALLMHLGSLSSFGVDYFSGFALTRNLQDSFIRMPLWTMVKRPKYIARGDTTRRRFFIPPLRPFGEQDEEGGSEEE